MNPPELSDLFNPGEPLNLSLKNDHLSALQDALEWEAIRLELKATAETENRP